MKKVWITALSKDLEKTVAEIFGALDTYALAADGHFFNDDLGNQAGGQGVMGPSIGGDYEVIGPQHIPCVLCIGKLPIGKYDGSHRHLTTKNRPDQRGG